MKNIATISKIIYNENAVRPILGNFQNGVLDTKAHSRLAVDIVEDAKKNRKAAVALNNHLYLGDVKKNDNYNNFIAVKKRNSSKMILIEVDNCLFSAMLPKQSSVEDNVKSPAVSKGELNKKFGSKRAKRITEQYERMKMNTDNVAQVLENTAASIEVKESDLVQVDVSSTDASYKPHINRNASRVEEVYNMNDLLPLNDLAAIAEDIDSVLMTDEKTIKENLCPIISEEVLNIIKGQSSKDNLPILVYVDCLIKMIQSPSRIIALKRFNPSPNFSRLGTYIMNNFTLMVNNSRTRPVTMRDKTMCHILVLLMMVFNYKLSLEPISKILKTGVKKLIEISRVLGFSLERFSKDVELKLPLPAISMPAAGKRGRK